MSVSVCLSVHNVKIGMKQNWPSTDESEIQEVNPPKNCSTPLQPQLLEKDI